MKNELEKVLSFLEKVEREGDVIRHSYEACVDCQVVAEMGELGPEHSEHTVVLQDFDHSGVSEWIRCLKWVLEKEDK